MSHSSVIIENVNEFAKGQNRWDRPDDNSGFRYRQG